MDIPGKKSLAEHREYVAKLARLSFYFARKMKERLPDMPLGELLRDRTPLLFHALNYKDYETRWNNPDCRRIIAQAEALQGLPAQEFEDRMFAALESELMEKAERSYPVSVGMKAHPWGDDWSGSLKVDPPDPAGKRAPNMANFHIANALAPQSIYSDPRHLPECFLEIMDYGERKYGFDTLCTGTWLNDTPRWLALFPKEWTDNLSPRSERIGWHFGYWGQLVNARGTFNDKAGQYVRANLALKYRSRASHCSFVSMRRHLSELLGGVRD